MISYAVRGSTLTSKTIKQVHKNFSGYYSETYTILEKYILQLGAVTGEVCLVSTTLACMHTLYVTKQVQAN